MRRPHKAITAAMLGSTLALAGCGTGSSNPSTPLKATRNLAQVSFKSAAIDPAKTRVPTIPSLYTCDGKNTPPPLEWGPVPPKTGELVLFLLGLTPVPGSSNVTISIEWALAGINPALHHLLPGALPEGAHLGLTTSHTRSYSICPQHGQTRQYQFELYGLPEGDAVPLDFNGLGILSKLAFSGSHAIANAHGSFGAIYKRS
jgi:phosphatidylethanolamine-binding protein (PEBP) family uncharacterized protein